MKLKNLRENLQTVNELGTGTKLKDKARQKVVIENVAREVMDLILEKNPEQVFA